MGAEVVVITGAGSGIGWGCAEALARDGATVVAGVLDDAQAQWVAQQGLEGVHPIPLDVTSADQIESAVERTEQIAAGRPIVGLVNNAGIAVAGPLEYLSDADLRLQFDVNVLGLMAVTRAFLPALRRSRGRIINVGSVGGRLSIPFTGPYNASKFAVRALSDALRVELRPSGIKVVLIEPGPIDTPIWQRSMDAAIERLDRLPAQARERYRVEIDTLFEMTRKTAAAAIGVQTVVDAIVEAVYAKRPPTSRLLGVQAYVQAAASVLPDRLRDRVLMAVMGLPSRRDEE